MLVIEQTGSNANEIVSNVQVCWSVDDFKVVWLVIVCWKMLISHDPKTINLILKFNFVINLHNLLWREK